MIFMRREGANVRVRKAGHSTGRRIVDKGRQTKVHFHVRKANYAVAQLKQSGLFAAGSVLLPESRASD